MTKEFMLLLGGSIFTLFTSKLPNDDYWYDYYNNYYDFDEMYTQSIDNFLIENPKQCQIRSYQMESHIIPGVGIHYYYPYGKDVDDNDCCGNIKKLVNKWMYYIGFIKKIDHINNRKITRYIMFIAPHINVRDLQKITKLITTPPNGKIAVMHIDLSEHTAKVVQYTQDIQGSLKPNQKFIVDTIIGKYTKINSKRNIKAMISGNRGLGKGYVGQQIKLHLDKSQNTNSLLFYDFNPMSIGVDIITLALSKASNKTPVILIINEIDKIYEYIHNDKQIFDPRTQHARDIPSFHNMLDDIDKNPNVICIMTTEKQFGELYQIDGNKSFMRNGRVDMFFGMKEYTSFMVDPQSFSK